MSNLKVWLAAAFLVLAVSDTRGQPAPYSRMGFGARGIAMSNAMVADATGATSPFYNPALAPLTARQNLEATVALLSMDRQLQFLQLAAPMRPRAGVAAGLIHAGVSNIDGRDDSGYHTRDYSTDEYTFFLAFGTRIGERVTAGVNLQLFRADFAEQLQPLNSIGIDLGLNVRILEGLHVGAVVEDLLARYEWDTSGLYGSSGTTTTDRFPIRVRFGAAYTLLNGRAQINAEYESLAQSRDWRTRAPGLTGDRPGYVSSSESLMMQDNRLRMGAEYRLAEPFSVRAGVDRIGSETLRPTAGFMLEQPVGRLIARVDYAFVLEPFEAGSLHFVTLRLGF